MEIKKCPFCGGEAKVYTTSHGYNNNSWGDCWKIECASCKIGSLKEYKTKVYRAKNGDLVIENDGRKEAIEAWNRRVDDGRED